MQIEPEIAGRWETTGAAAFVGVYIFTSDFTGWSFTEVKDFDTLGSRIARGRAASAPDASVVRLRLVYVCF